jgi:hypothetical protein
MANRSPSTCCTVTAGMNVASLRRPSRCLLGDLPPDVVHVAVPHGLEERHEGADRKGVRA